MSLVDVAYWYWSGNAHEVVKDEIDCCAPHHAYQLVAVCRCVVLEWVSVHFTLAIANEAGRLYMPVIVLQT